MRHITQLRSMARDYTSRWLGDPIAVEGTFPRPFFWLCLACLIGYALGIQGDFMLDDHVVLFGAKGIENKNLLDLIMGRQHFFYRPLGHLVLFFCQPIFGRHPSGYHAVNLALLILVVWTAHQIFLELTLKPRVAFTAALLFAVHPFNAFLVDYITASVIGTFLLSMELSFLAFLRHLRTGADGAMRLSLLLFAIALLSHEMGVLMPMIVLCHLHFMLRKNLRETTRLVAPYVVVTAGYLLLRALLFPLSGTLHGIVAVAPYPARYLGALGELLGWYFKNLLWPNHVLFLWSAQGDAKHALPAAILISGYLIGSAYLLFRYWRQGPAAFSLAMFTCGFLPILTASFTYVPQGYPLIEPHWFYFPSLGFFLLLGLGLEKSRAVGTESLGSLLSVLLVTTWSFQLIRTHKHWLNEETYSRYWLSQNDRDWTPYHGLGRAYLRKGDPEAASQIMEQGLARIASSPPAILLTDLAVAHQLAGREGQALHLLALSLSRDPSYVTTYEVLGGLALRQGRYPLAQASFTAALNLDPRSMEAKRGLETCSQQLHPLEPKPAR